MLLFLVVVRLVRIGFYWSCDNLKLMRDGYWLVGTRWDRTGDRVTLDKVKTDKLLLCKLWPTASILLLELLHPHQLQHFKLLQQTLEE